LLLVATLKVVVVVPLEWYFAVRKPGLLIFVFVLGYMTFAGMLVPTANARAGLAMPLMGSWAGPPPSPVVKIKKKKHHDDDKGNGTKTPGERSCPPGYVVLDKPNKYGAFCEPKEGLPPPSTEKCKLGMVGTPPNCACPDRAKFFGYKGCLQLRFCDGWHSNEYAAQRQKTWIPNCKAQSGIPDCKAVTRPGVVFECCCYY
jgi:hypothetical protein